MTIQNFFVLNQMYYLSPLVIIFIITFLFILQTYIQYKVFKAKGTLSHGYTVNTFLMFAPIYEEVIFRGFLFFGLIPIFGVFGSAIMNSILFGLWHIRSIFYISHRKVVIQILYTALVVAPICLYSTYATGNIWFAVIIHYINNIVASAWEDRKILK